MGIYRPRSPQKSPFYQCIADHFEEFIQVYDERYEREYGFWRPVIGEVIEKFLECGDLTHGFVNQEGAPSKLISVRKGFSLGHLLEIKSFDHYMSRYRGDELSLILEEDWYSARTKAIEQFRNSTNLELTLKIIDHFKDTNPKIFLSECNSYPY